MHPLDLGLLEVADTFVEKRVRRMQLDNVLLH